MIPAYDLTEVSFSYGAEPVLRIRELEIGKGEIVGIVGPNGSGKTTLLHLLAFLETPRSGEIMFFGERVGGRNVWSIRRQVALLLQNPYLFHESVLANVTWALRLRNIGAEEARKAALRALDQVGLGAFSRRSARSLSGGESQRVALARALALEPSVLLLDEPFNHMDREAVRRTEDIVRGMCCQTNTTVIFTTHALEKVHAVAHRMIHLWQGQTVPTGPENLFKGTLKGQGRVFDTGRLAIRLESMAVNADFITIDPHGIGIHLASGSGDPTNGYSGRVVGLTEECGLVKVVVEAGERLNALVKAEDPVVPSLRLGQSVIVTLGPHALSLL